MNIFFKTVLLLIFLIKPLYTSNIEEDFNSWVVSYKKYALDNGVSQEQITNSYVNCNSGPNFYIESNMWNNGYG